MPWYALQNRDGVISLETSIDKAKVVKMAFEAKHRRWKNLDSMGESMDLALNFLLYKKLRHLLDG